MEDRHFLPGSMDAARRKTGDSCLVSPPQYIETPSATVTGEKDRSLLLEYLDIVRINKNTLILLTFIGSLIALLVTILQTPIYQARASLEIRNLNENFLNMREVSPVTNDLGSSQAESDLETQAKILQSQAVLGRAIDKLDLAKTLSEQLHDRGLFAWRRFAGQSSEPKGDSAREDVLHLVAKNLIIRAEPNTRLVDVLYDSKDPQLAADFVNALTAEFIQQNVEARSTVTQQTGDWLTRQLDDVRAKLEKSEDELQRYAHASGLLFTSEKVGLVVIEDNIAEEKLRQLQEELSRAHADRIAKQSRYEQVASVSPESLSEVLDDKTLENYQVKLTDLRRQSAELSSSLTPAHPSVRKLQAQINTMESALRSERENVTQSIRNEYVSAARRENLLAANYASQARLVSEQGADVAHYNILKSDVDTNRQLYNGMLRNVQEAGMTSALRASNVRVVDPAKPPTRPYKPNLLLNMALGVFSGAFFGFIFVLLRERNDHSIRTPGQLALSLGVPELGAIPSSDAGARSFLAHHDKGSAITYADSKKGGEPRQVELITALRKHSVLADCFRATVTSILFAEESGNRPQIIVLTSAGPREGKTTVACNLALALAEIGLPVLLIDGDLRKGRLHEIFQLSNVWGLSDLLAGKKPSRESGKMYAETGYRRLCVLPSGSIPSLCVAGFHSPQTLEFLNRMRQEFHTIIIDTPPMLQIADARILGRLTDGVILVVRSAQTSIEIGAAAAQRFVEDGTRIWGTILNHWDPKRSGPSGYAYASYYHHHPSDIRG